MVESDTKVTVSTIDSFDRIPDQKKVSWAIAVSVSWGSLRRRVFRSLITMIGVILAIAFLTYMLVTDDIVRSLVAANSDVLNVLLQKADIDITQSGTDTRMILLITLSLFTCLVGIVNSMLMSVTERIKEIGTMKCLGALDSFIVKIYFIEASLQGIIGTCLGLLIGFVVGFAVSVQSFRWFVIEYLPVVSIIKSIGISFTVGSIISIFAAIAPAQWAASKEPVEAMRIEE